MKTLVLGLGNPILTDDGVGIHIVREVAACCHRGNVAFAETSLGGLRLLDILSGFDRVIMVDAVQTPGGEPGDLYRLTPYDLPRSRHSGSTHDLSLTEALALGRSLGKPLPADEAIVIVGVDVQDALSFGERCTPMVSAAIPSAVDLVLTELESERFPSLDRLQYVRGLPSVLEDSVMR